ncbi:hypothetical protein SELMODRAFT_124442 [Selaginella moellendorffii]|uniref:O-methyltransferase C-terminal domain-containing protein n=1 Tax=Selaginella moellendorffii TaxID=88036 RepID=D8STC6_SELML|nr:hypothetical protein SELMODRAFT_124442 [Selaginella moellendorffii]
MILPTNLAVHDTITPLLASGGIGNLRVILGCHQGIKGIDFSLPHVMSRAPALPDVSSDMFAKVPPGDVIFMKFILHDWKDETCMTLLITAE